MKKKIFLACLFPLITSCGIYQNPNCISTDFTMSSTQEGFKKDDFGQIVYYYKGNLRNNTQNLYKEVRINMRVIMVLENGQQLTDESIHHNDGLVDLSGLFSLHILDMVEPGKDYKVRDFESASIDPSYAKYPIQSVSLQFTVETKDEINGTSSDKILIENEEVTDKWREMVSNIDPEAAGYKPVGGGSYIKIYPKNRTR